MRSHLDPSFPRCAPDASDHDNHVVADDNDDHDDDRDHPP
jgi:hypothetical protein